MAPASSMRLLLGGLATATIVEAAVDSGAGVPVSGSAAVAPLAPAVPVVAPARMLPLYDCDVEKDTWETAWTPDWKAWCCENDDSKRGCPPTTTVTTTSVTTTTTTTTIDEKAAAEACSSSCTAFGATFTCSSRIQWASEHTFKEKESPCSAAVDLVHSQCDACSKCTIEASGCSAGKGEDEGAQEEKPEPQKGVPSEKDAQVTPEAKEEKEETKAETEKSADEKTADLKADKVVDRDASEAVDLAPQSDAPVDAQDGAEGQAKSDVASQDVQLEKSDKKSTDAAEEQEHKEPAQASTPATMNLRIALAEKFEEPASRRGMLSSPWAASASPRSSRILDGLWMALMGGVAFAVATSTYNFVLRRRIAAERELMGAGGATEEFLQDDEEAGAEEVQE